MAHKRKKVPVRSQDQIVRSCNANFKVLGMITLWAWSISLRLILTKLEVWPIAYGGIAISDAYAYDVSGMLIFAACFGDFIVIFRITTLIKELDVNHLNQVCLLPSIWNFLADFGSSLSARFQSCLALGFLIVSWWVGYTSISLFNPHRWLVPFELMFLGAGTLCLGAIGDCTSVMRGSSGANGHCFRLPLIGSVTVQDIAVTISAGAGASISLAAPKLLHMVSVISA
jgi:hypothetical protein